MCVLTTNMWKGMITCLTIAWDRYFGAPWSHRWPEVSSLDPTLGFGRGGCPRCQWQGTEICHHYGGAGWVPECCWVVLLRSQIRWHPVTILMKDFDLPAGIIQHSYMEVQSLSRINFTYPTVSIREGILFFEGEPFISGLLISVVFSFISVPHHNAGRVMFDF